MLTKRTKSAFFTLVFASVLVLTSRCLTLAEDVAGIPGDVAQYVSAPETTINVWPATPPGGIPDNIGDENWKDVGLSLIHI